MLCNREGIRIFLLKIVSSMGCFFGCFRIKDGDRSQAHLFSNNASSKSRDPLVSRNQLSSLFSLEGSPCKDEENNGLQSKYNAVAGDTDDRDLKAEAKFLKSCGTLLQTPAEIRKASEKLKVLPHDGGDESCKFHSWLPGTSCKKLSWEEQHDEVSISNIKFLEEQGRICLQENSVPLQCRSISTGQKQSIANTYGSPKDSGFKNLEMETGVPIHCKGNNDLHETTAEIPNATSQCKKCVRFECDTAHNSGMNFLSLRSSPSERESHNCNLPDSLCTDVRKAKLIVPKHSPYPTPLKLTDEMETPGTIYPAKLENFAGGKNARIRSQYVYPVFNPIENASQWNALKNDFESSWVGHPGESFEQCRKGIWESVKTPERGFKDNAEGMMQNHKRPTPVDASLSHWLRPVSSNDRNQNHKAIPNGNSYTGKCSDDDRPILGTVAAHWNDDEPSDIPPKSWDGNGIPNSTNKYKEDQKVSWHATPFEERLEKALSDERLFPQRNLIGGKPIDFDENEESDTAASNFHTAEHLQSPVQL
ncbi:hypothetical protein AAC387_Pa05g3419 [Persea americana]